MTAGGSDPWSCVTPSIYTYDASHCWMTSHGTYICMEKWQANRSARIRSADKDEKRGFCPCFISKDGEKSEIAVREKCSSLLLDATHVSTRIQRKAKDTYYWCGS